MSLLQTTVSSQGQIFLPQQLREKYDIKTGDRILIFPKEDIVVLKRVPRDISKATLGILKRSIAKTGGVEQSHKKWKKEWEKKI